MTGTLWLIPTPIGEPAHAHRMLPPATLQRVSGLDYFLVENARSARAFLKAAGTEKPLQALELVELSEHTPASRIPELLAPVLAGRDAGLLAEAGAPAVADPGAALIAAAHRHAIAVRPLVGPSAILLAVMASGMNGQCFSFVGYLPTAAQQRLQRLRELERRSRLGNETVLFIETPYRNQVLLDAALLALAPATRLMLASELTTDAERIIVDTIDGWRRARREIPKAPAVFGLHAAPDPMAPRRR